MKAAERRKNLKTALIVAAEQVLAADGLGALRARSLAETVGCAVGAIYNVVADLDELILLVNSRTIADLERVLTETTGPEDRIPASPDEAVKSLVRLAIAYTNFAAANTQRYRALFEHRLAPGGTMPGWYIEQQMRLFSYVEGPLRVLQPAASAKRIALLARSLVSAVHGIVMLGLEEKLYTVPLTALREQVTLVVSAIGRGLAAP
jgi:AcrR family transcriptional regulator